MSSQTFDEGSVSPSLMPKQYSTFVEWLNASRAAALQFVADSGAAHAERFMQFLALWVTAIPDPNEPTWQRIDGANKKLEFALISPGHPFVVTALRMEPGCILPAHCHPGGGGITLCIDGSLMIQHYDLVAGSAAFSETGAVAEVEEVSVTRLRKNQFTLFTPSRANLHQLQAGPDGAVAVDIVVQWAGAGEFSYLKLTDSTPASQAAMGRRHRGTWVGMDIARA